MSKVVLFIMVLFSFCSSVSAQNVTYWLEPGGYMAEISSAETQRRMRESLVELEDACAVRFTEIQDERKARIRFYFKPQSQIKYSALGLAHPRQGYIEINNTRKVGLTNRFNRICQTVTQHEMMHMLWTSLHSQRETSIMHAGSIPPYFDGKDVTNIQLVFGRNNNGRTFRPFPLKKAGILLRESTARYDALWVERERLLAERDASTDKEYRTAKQAEILANLALIITEIPVMITHATSWFAWDVYWKFTHGYVNR